MAKNIDALKLYCSCSSGLEGLACNCSQHGLRRHRFSHLSGYFVAVNTETSHTLNTSMQTLVTVDRACGDSGTDRSVLQVMAAVLREVCFRARRQAQCFMSNMSSHFMSTWCDISLWRSNQCRALHSALRMSRDIHSCGSSVHLYIDPDHRPRLWSGTTHWGRYFRSVSAVHFPMLLCLLF